MAQIRVVNRGPAPTEVPVYQGQLDLKAEDRADGVDETGSVRKFDLNIERVLEHWTLAHALREIIANALDEHALTGTAEPAIWKDGDEWHIRDWGRGLQYEHLTQNENKEKLAHPDQVIGKFGVGLKDALATFNRRRVRVLVRSRHGDISVAKERKHGFEDLATLHALIREPSTPPSWTRWVDRSHDAVFWWRLGSWRSGIG